MIIDPFGEVLAGPLHDEPGLLVADLDLDEVTRGRYDFDATGHYSRPDIFSLTVNTSVKAPVTWRCEAPPRTRPKPAEIGDAVEEVE